MVVRLRLLASSLLGGGLLLAILCLGAQNLDQRPSLNLGFARSTPLPAGFLVGIAPQVLVELLQAVPVPVAAAVPVQV